MIKATNLIQTGIAWIPKIPSDWELKRIKLLFDFNKNIVGKTSADYDVLSLTTKGVIKRDIESGMGKFPASFDGYQIVKPNSIMLCLFDMDVTPRVVGHVDDDGIISAAYTNIIPKKSLNAKYYYYYFLLQDKNKSLLALGTGIRITLNKDFFGTLKIPVPPIEVQNSIVAYLDKKNNEIDKFIRNKERLIELLEASKKSKIFDAITKGLNRNVEQKESGFAWIGSMPKHWGLNKIKSFANHVQRGSSPTYVNESELVVISQASMSSGFIDETKFKYQTKAKIETFKGRLFPNDVLLASTGGGVLGKAIVFEREGNYIADGHLTIIRDKKKRFNPKFLYYFLSINFDFIEGYLGQGSTNQTELQRGWFRDLYLPFPMLKEQNEIVVFINEFCKEINSAISKAEKEISSIKEYREALITDLVTGKRSVPQLQMD